MTQTHHTCPTCQAAAKIIDRCRVGRDEAAGLYRRMADAARLAGNHQEAHEYRTTAARIMQRRPV